MKKNKNNLIAYYSILLGVSVLLMWIFILLNETIPEGKNEMIFHLFSELLMAVLCIVSGMMLLKKGLQILNVAAHAMVIYSVLNAAGYYSERNEFIMTVIFLILFIISLMILIIHFFSEHSVKNET